MSCQPCGCDREASYVCLAHQQSSQTQLSLTDFIPVDIDTFQVPTPPIRQFETGATRDQDITKMDYEGFLSPLVLERYAVYMHKNRIQKDGTTRDSDNWQRGIPLAVYVKSLWRHFMDMWSLHRGAPNHGDGYGDAIEEALCAIMFNSMGYLHEFIKGGRQK